MISFFPQIYPDELLYSWFSRYHVRSGHLTYRATAEKLFRNKDVTPSPEFLVPLTDEAFSVVTKQVNYDSLIEKHTMLPYYIRFLPLERRKKAFDLLKAMDKKFYDCLYMRKNKTAHRKSMRYCPICAHVDRKIYGETYWHRKHQLMGIDICLIHRCRLEDSTLGITSEELRFQLTHAETVIPSKTTPDYDVSEQECQIARFILQVFEADMDFENDIPVGKFLHSALDGTPYVSARGQQIYAKRLFYDLNTYYSGFRANPLQEWWTVQKVFCAQNFHVLDICLIALYLAIPPEKLIRIQLPEAPSHERFDRCVMELRNKGLTYAQISEVMGAHISLVKAVGEKRYRSTQHLQSKKGTVKTTTPLIKPMHNQTQG